MSRWWRAYDEAATDPKLQLLSDSLFRAWFNLMCLSSKHGGELPPLAHVAYTLQMKPEKAAQVLTQLCTAGLLDRTETGFIPHNWKARQYKSDVSTERVQRFRNGKRNVSETPPETETETETDNRSEANASGAEAPSDPRKRLFSDGLKKLAALTGKGPDACRSFVGKCLQAAGDDAIVVLGLIEDAERNQVANASSWIAARLKATGPPLHPAKPLSAFQQQQEKTRDVVSALRGTNPNGAANGGPFDRVLPVDQRQQPGDLRGGHGGAVLALPRTSSSGGDRSG